ncbi:hypothetical protein KIH86_13595 [Paenibacillus sp. HN-1]|uniref:hypothetical protein n=1 Tax=Paenibacillus TaxID=44249 RepID=UPI001CA83D92|nr:MULTISPECIES: hypothetical protein [Paenibacillus]MBY9080746.1 hypothetical protein [Paenibacillus sp. CGMCC 1.18879]MBY9085262.1 hypothetical protein [Paenibacillus sinensis]
MNGKILEITDPPIKAYPDYAYPLSITLNSPHAWDHFYCNYIQLYFDETDLRNPVRYYYVDVNRNIWNTRHPLIHYQTIHRDTLARLNKDIIECACAALDLDRYVMAFVNEYYIKDRWAYQQMEYPHAIFIYGYDRDKSLFYTAAYDKNLHYTYGECSFDELREAYNHNPLHLYDDNNYIYLMKYNSTSKRYELDLNAMIQQLKEFLNSSPTTERYNEFFNSQEKLYFGMDIYEPLIMHLYAIHQNNWDWNIVKPVYLLWEHKKLMVDRIQYLIQKNILPDHVAYLELFRKLVDEYSVLQILFLKYKKTRDKGQLEKIIGKIKDAVSIEHAAISWLIDDLEDVQRREAQELEQYPVSSASHCLKAAHHLDRDYEGRLRISLNIIPFGENMEGIIGFSDREELITITDLIPIQIRLNNEGCIDALNGEGFMADNRVAYRKKELLTLQIDIDLSHSVFDVASIDPGGRSVTIAKNYEFNRNGSRLTKVGNMLLISNSVYSFTVSSYEIEEVF